MSKLIGQTLLNQFRVDEFIASGGMGAVYRVWDLKRNVPLAMKVLHADLADDPTIFKRFQREARTLQQLKHPNIVSFYGLYQDQGATFILEAFIPGSSLKDILRQSGSLPLNEVLVYMKGLCAALGYAHSKNIVHCDVKPGNVMVGNRGEIYLADFGIARFVGATTTSTMGVAGTPAYMAPEQIRARGITLLTDIYALGVLLFELLTGQRPFRGTEPETEAGGDTPSERIKYGHLRVPPPNPRQFNPSISPALAQVILRALAKNPAERYQSAQEFFQALCRAAQRQPEQVADETTFVGQYTAPPPVPAPRTSGSPHPALAQRRKNTALVFVFISGAFIVLLILGVTMIGGGISTPIPDAPTTSPIIMTENTLTIIATDAPLTKTITVTLTEIPTLIPTSTLTETPTPIPTETPTWIPTSGITPIPNGPEPTGKIVFLCQVTDAPDGQICMANADRSGYVQLTSLSSVSYIYPEFSPDGNQIFFTADYDVYRMDITGYNVIRLTNCEQKKDHLCFAPRVSPNGKKIIYSRTIGGTRYIYKMDVVGGSQENWGEGMYPGWLTDSTILFFAKDPVWQVFSMDISGNHRLKRTSGKTDYYNVDGSAPDRITYSAEVAGQNQIFVMRIDGSELHQLTTQGNNIFPSFSPDGDWVIFQSNVNDAGGDACNLFMVRRDGTDLQPFMDRPDCLIQPRWGP